MAQDQSQRQSPQAKPRRARKLSSTQVMFAVILAIALMLAVQFSSRISDERRLAEIRNTLEDEIELLRNEQSDLIGELAFVQSDAFVEQWARSEGRMVRDNMVLVIPIPSTNTVAQAVASAASVPETPVQLETTLPDPDPWQLWWALFFDAPAPRFNS